MCLDDLVLFHHRRAIANRHPTCQAYLFYQAEDSKIINAYFACDWTTGSYIASPEEVYSVTNDANAPSVHERSGLSVEELGDAGGFRVFYHDEDERVNMVAWDDDTDWIYLGPVSRMPVTGRSIGSALADDMVVSVAFPHDDGNIAVALYNDTAEEKWTLGMMLLRATLPRKRKRHCQLTRRN
jgi:hypothetical protein